MTNKKNARSGEHSGHSNKITSDSDYSPDIAESARFLRKLDPKAERFTFQTFGEGRHKDEHNLRRILHGALSEHADELARLNIAGAGIFVTVNETNFKGRSKGDIKRVRAVFADADGGISLEHIMEHMPMRPHIVVASSPGKWHVYWRVTEMHLDRFPSVQRMIAERCGTDPSVTDVSRVMRLPGFFHLKGEPFRVQLEGF